MFLFYIHASHILRALVYMYGSGPKFYNNRNRTILINSSFRFFPEAHEYFTLRAKPP